MYSNISGINGFLGYRTRRSMASKEMWEYAQKVAGKIWIMLGAIEMVVLVILFLLEKLFFSEYTAQLIETIILIIIIIIVEIELKRFEKKQK